MAKKERQSRSRTPSVVLRSFPQHYSPMGTDWTSGGGYGDLATAAQTLMHLPSDFRFCQAETKLEGDQEEGGAASDRAQSTGK